MTIKDCIDIVDNQKPNQYSVKEKVMWLSFLDETIINDVLKTHEGYDGRYDLFTGYSEDKLTITLIAPSPYDRIYPQYLKMRIDGENGETARYNNSRVMFNSYMQEYKKYYNKTHMPIDSVAKAIAKSATTTQMGVTDAQFEGLVKELTFVLTEYFSDAVSEDKIYDAASKYIQNNWQQFVGKDGKTPVRGVDYFTEEDKLAIIVFVREEMDKVLPEAKEYADDAEKNAKAYADTEIDSVYDTITSSVATIGRRIDREATISKEYTDNAIQQAILDSWEVGV